MRLIINTSNLNKGGGIQVALSFISECIKFTRNEYHVFLCENLTDQINPELYPSNFHFYIIPVLPSIKMKGLKTIKKLEKLEKQINPQCVFSIFGPTYWTPKSPHLMGYAIPHFIYPDSPFFSIISKKEKFKWILYKMLKRIFLKKNSKYYHVETNDIRQRLSKFLTCPLNNIFTVSNTYSSIYNSFKINSTKILPEKVGDEFRFVCVSAYYFHKNLDILNDVIPLLKEKGFINVKFILTINENVFQTIFTNVAKTQIINNGPISINDCPQLYSECDAMFLPTLIECFSANYPEAMKMQKPILTSDLSFAHDVCGDAAIYFRPLDKEDIVDSILLLINDKSLQLELIRKGNEELKKFNTASERAAKYLSICKQISKTS